MDKMKKISIPLIDKVEIIHAVADGSMTNELIKKKYNLRSSSNIGTLVVMLAWLLMMRFWKLKRKKLLKLSILQSFKQAMDI
jgi:hypothetical protein